MSRSEPSSLSTCAGPIAHSTIWWVSGLCSSRIVTSSATSRCRAEANRSSSAREAAWMATGSSGSGSSHGSTSAGCSVVDKVSDVSAAPSLETSTMSPATACGVGRVSSPTGVASGPTRSSSTSWSAWASTWWKANCCRCPQTCSALSGVRVPEKTRTSESRPTYGSLVVRTTSATSGPRGIAAQLTERPPVRPDDAGQCGGGRRREALLEQDVQRLEPDAGAGMGRDDREEPGRRHRCPEVADDRVELDLLAVQVALEELLVLGLGDDRLHQLRAPLGDQLALGVVRWARRQIAGHVDGLAQQVQQARHRTVLDQRQRDRLRVAEDPLAALRRLVEVGTGLLELGDRDRPRLAVHLALAPQQPGGVVDLPGRGDHEQHGVRGPETGPYLAHEVRLSGCVEQVDGHAAADHGTRAQRLRRRWLAPQMATRQAGGQQMLEQRRLAGSGRADQNDVANAVRRSRTVVGIGGHDGTLPLRLRPAACGERPYQRTRAWR